MKNMSLKFILPLTTLAMASCSETNSLTTSKYKDREVVETADFDVNTYKLNNLVCDPMGGGQDVGLGDGLKAELYYSNGINYDRVNDYFELGTRSKYDLFYSALNVPTRRFELGFPTETGEIVKNDDGEELNEYFSLKFHTVLKLGEGDEPGLYEFAVLADDGTVIKYRDDQGDMKILVDNDGDHPTRMGCSETTIYMDYDTELVLEIDYYQGPRYHIALVPLWRKIDNQRQQETLCGQKGNSLFFDFNNNSKPQKAYNDLMDRGWAVWKQRNFNLPVEAIFNPCIQGQAPVISEFQITDQFDGVLRVTWTTDLQATSQVRIVNLATGEETITDSDNVLRTEHSVTLTGLAPGVEYVIQGISITQSFGKGLSGGVIITPL